MKLKKNLLQMEKMDYTPLSQTSEGILVGGFSTLPAEPGIFTGDIHINVYCPTTNNCPSTTTTSVGPSNPSQPGTPTTTTRPSNGMSFGMQIF